jgi:hypothetical protein
MTTTAAHAVTFRTARRDDLVAIIAMLADDQISRDRTGYTATVTDELSAAFDEITRDPSNELLVGEHDANGQLVDGKLVNGELVNGELVNGELVNGELVNGELVNGELVNGGEPADQAIEPKIRPLRRRARRDAPWSARLKRATLDGRAMPASTVPTSGIDRCRPQPTPARASAHIADAC